MEDIIKNVLQSVEKYPKISLLISAFLVYICTFASGATTPIIVLFFIVILIAVYLRVKNKLTEQNLCTIILILGFLLRVCYVLYTDCTVRQHDVESFGGGIGHSGYIEYIYQNFKLPEGDVRETWQFYHPPLSHIISALFMRVSTFFGVAYSNACESLQILSLIYSSLCVIVSDKILIALNLRGKGRVVALSLVSFSPTFIIFSGSINNDILAVLFTLTSLLFSIRWYYSKSYKDIIMIALTIGFGMFTKLSVWMVAPPIALLFLLELIYSIRNKSAIKLIPQFCIFGVICLPIGLYWSIRNLILYGVPLNYIPRLETTNFQYIGEYSIFERLTNFKISSVFVSWGEPFYEFNPTLSILKTSLFGESINATDYPQILLPATILFILGAILLIMALVLFSFYVFKNTNTPKPILILLASLSLLSTLMYYYFCFDYPFTCTMNIRYAAHLIPILAIGIAYFTNEHKSKLLSYLSLLFCVFSSIVYLII